MKKITLLLILIMSTCYVNAQVVAYSFSQSNGTYTEITGGTVLGTETTDDQRFVDPADPTAATFALTGVGFPIGFNFVFDGAVYDRFAVNANGWISLGKSSLGALAVNMNSSSAYTPLSSTLISVSDELVARISGLGRDLQAQVGASIRFELTGTAPNQVLVIQFKNYKKFGTTGTGDNFNFQIRLHETTNLVEVVYGTQVNNATSSVYDVGLRANPAATASNFNSRTSLTSWAATTSSVNAFGQVTMSATNVPTSGLTFTWTPPTCPGATGITTTNLTNSSANVTWNEPVPAPSNGYEYVITSTAGLPTAAGTASVTNTASATGLTANTTYFVYVRSNCGTSFGNWILAGTFRTLCNEVTDFVQNFDSFPTGTGSLPDCWSRLGTSTTANIVTGGAAPMSPLNRLIMGVSTTTTAYVLMAPVSNLQANTHRLKFKAYATAANRILSVGYFATPGDVTTYVEIDPIQLPSTTLATTQEFTVIPSSIPAGVTQLVFNIVQPTPASTTVYIDDVKWEVNSTCVEPTVLTASAITNTTANLGWTNGSTEIEWDIQYGLTNFALGTGTTVSAVSSNPYTLMGLTANTSYQFYVRAVCTGPVTSPWAGPFTFKTQCDDVTSFSENFDSYTTNFSTTMPDCWSRGGNSTSTYITTSSVAPMSPSNRLYMFASGTANPPTEGYAIMPAVSNLQANTHRLKFKAYATLANRFIEVGYLTDPANVSTFIQIQEIFLPGTAASTAQEFFVNPTGIPAGVKHLAFKNPGFPSSSTTAYIDDVAWEPIPACSNPTNPSVIAITSDSATLTWAGNPTDVTWEIEYGAPGFTLGAGTVVPAATNPFTLTGLMPQTNYQFYVRAVCAGPLTSTNSFSASFLTACVPITTLPWTENFDSLTTVGTTVFPPCWLEENGDWTSAVTGTYNTPNSGPNYIRNSWSATNEFIWTGGFQLTAGTSYDFSSFVQGDGYTGWVVDYFSNTTQSSVGATQIGTSYTVPGTSPTGPASIQPYAKITRTFVPTTSGVYYFAVRVNQPSSSPWYVAFDDFELKETPTAIPSCDTNLVATPNACGNFANQLTWDNNPLATGYVISIGTTSGGTDIANNVTISLNSYSFVGAINTQYFWTVTPFNGAGSATGCTEQSFTTSATGCYCPSQPTSVDGTGITNVQVGSTNYPIAVTAAPYYSDQTAVISNMIQGISNNVQISFNTSIYDYNTYIYVDLNDNFIFDANELLFSGVSSSTSPNVYNASFLMPLTAPLGNHRMRIVSADFMPIANVNPCYSADYGFTVDFTINVIAAPACLPPTALTASAITATSATLGWTEMGTATVWDIESGLSGFTPTGTPTNAGVTNPFNLTGLLDNTTYSYYVRADCGTANGTSTWAGPFSFTTACLATNAPYVMNFENATVPALPNCTSQQNVGTGNLWTVSNNPGAGFTTNTLRYLWNSTNAANTWFYTQGINLTAGSTYTVAFDYGSSSTFFTESLRVAYGTSADATSMTNTIVDFPAINSGALANSTTQITPTVTGVYYFGFHAYSVANQDNIYVDNINIAEVLSNDTFNSASFVAYPNPVRDVLNLSYSSEISSVRVMNLLGQEVISRNVGANSTQLDLTNLTTGAYIVNVTIGDFVKSIKVIKQ